MNAILVLLLINVTFELFLILLCTSKYGTAILLVIEDLFKEGDVDYGKERSKL